MNVKTEIARCLEGLWLDDSTNLDECHDCRYLAVEYDEPQYGLNTKECMADGYDQCPAMVPYLKVKL